MNLPNCRRQPSRRLTLRTLSCCVSIWAAAAAAPEKPNFIVLFADDLGIDQIQVPSRPSHVYGYSGNNGTITTPHLAKFASEGLLFQTWYSSFHVCSPSRASMMTGRYSIRSGIGIPNSIYAPHAPGPDAGANLVLTAEAIGGLPLNETTTAEALKKVGYATMMLGKWHLGVRDLYLPSNRGFDEYFGVPFSQDMGLSFWETKNYKPEPPFVPSPLPVLNQTTIVEQPAGLHTLAARYAATAGEFIKRQAQAGTPFYLYMSFNHVHTPNSCGPAWCGRSTRGPIGDAVEEMDWSVGQIMEALHDSGVEDQTLVIFTSDNGAPQRPDGNLPLRGFKADTWEGGFREPAMARWPGKIRPGRFTQAIAATFDIHPTLLNLAGAPVPSMDSDVIDGIDLSPILFAEEEDAGAGHDCYMFYAYAVASDAANALSAVRCGDYKAYFFTFGSTPPPQPYRPGKQLMPLLFNLVEDPSELRPVDPHTKEYAAALQRINAAKEAHLLTITPVPNQNGRGSGKEYRFCAAPDGGLRHAQWPECTLTPENWEPAEMCASKVCLATNPALSKACKPAPDGKILDVVV